MDVQNIDLWKKFRELKKKYAYDIAFLKQSDPDLVEAEYLKQTLLAVDYSEQIANITDDYLQGGDHKLESLALACFALSKELAFLLHNLNLIIPKQGDELMAEIVNAIENYVNILKNTEE